MFTTAAVLICGAASTACGSGGEELRALTPETMFKLKPFEPGGPMEFSLAAIYINAPGKDVEIVQIRPVVTPNIEYIGAIAVWPREAKGNTSDGGPGFPPGGVKKYHPALGTVIPAAETAYTYPGEDRPRDIVVNAGFRLASADPGAVNSIEVAYLVNGETRREQSRVGVVACVGPCSDAAKYGTNLMSWQRDLLARHGIEEDD